MSRVQLLASLSWIEPVGWMLLHSVWLIGFIAVAYGLAESLLRKRSANVRYLVGCVALTASIAALPVALWMAPDAVSPRTPNAALTVNAPHGAPIAATSMPPDKTTKSILQTPVGAAVPASDVTITALDSSGPGAAPDVTPAMRVNEQPGAGTIGSTVESVDRWRQIESALRPWLPFLVTAWLVGVLLLSLRPLLGWLGIRRLRRTGVSAVPSSIRDMTVNLSRRLGITRTVAVLQSALVEVPCVIGVLKPVILLPASVLTGLTVEQLQAVLAHELAHVRRHDFLFNVVQTLVETLLFYHPAIWWLSRRIRQEREHCCDDIAISVCGDPAAYARMLISIDALRGRAWQPALAANGGSLVQRIRRLVPTTREETRSPWPLAAALVLLAFVISGVGQRPAVQAEIERPRTVIKPQPKVEGPFEDGEDGPRVKVEPVDQQAVRFREAGQKAFVLAGYELMAAAYSKVCERPSATIDDYMWLGHAYQLARNWPAAVEAYHGALAKMDAEIASTESQLKEFEIDGKLKDTIRLEKGSKYPFLKRAQEQLPQQWPDLVLQVGQLQLTELKDPGAAAKTLSKGLRFSPELMVPLEQLLAAAEAGSTVKWDHKQAARALSYIDPLETQRYLALAQEQLEQPAAAFDTWVRVRLCKIAYQMSYATSDPAHLKELARKLPQDSLKAYHHLALEKPDREPLKQHEARDFLKSGAANPFKATPLQGFDFANAGEAAASIAKLPDGRLLMAYATGDQHQYRINLSQSKDGVEWDAPWEFAHNSIFNTRSPSLLVDDQGEIWMLCLSKRLTTERFASAPYELWLTHSRNGREWSPLRSLQMQSDPPRFEIATSQYQEIPQLMRLPGNRFGIIWRDRFGAAQSPSAINTLSTLPLPLIESKPIVSNTQATFESNGRCHLVFDDFGRGLFYTRSDDMQTWLPLQRLGSAEKNSSISMPQLLIEGDRVALIHEQNSGTWLSRGTIAAEGLKLGAAMQITDHLMPLNGSRLRLDGDRALIPAGVPPYVPNLLTASFAELLAPQSD